MSKTLAPLWHIEEHLLALLDSIATCPDDLKPELQAEIDAYIGQEASKVDQVAHVLSALEYEQKCACDEIARLQERKKAAAAAQERLEAYVCRVLKMRGAKRLSGQTNSFSVRPSDAVKITDGAVIPTQYLRTTLEFSGEEWSALDADLRAMLLFDLAVTCRQVPDKAAIRKALKEGREVLGADLEFRDNLVRK